MKFNFNIKNLIINSIIILFGILIILFANYDSFLYKSNIMKITKIEEKKTMENQGVGYITESYYEQNITGVILNGKNKGLVVSAINERSTSNVYDEHYHEKDKVFVEITSSKNKTVNITNYKRDTYLVAIIVIFALAL